MMELLRIHSLADFLGLITLSVSVVSLIVALAIYSEVRR